MNASANRSSSAVVTPGRTCRPSSSSARPTSNAAARIASISVLSLRKTMMSPRGLRTAQGGLDRPMHVVHATGPRHLHEPPLRAVVPDQGRGLLAIDLEPLVNRALLVVGPQRQLHARMVVAM